jgi:hypothetical protein
LVRLAEPTLTDDPAVSAEARVQEVYDLAVSRGISQWRLHSKAQQLANFLEPNERVVELAYGRAGAVFIGGLTGKVLIACTDRRVLLPSVVWGTTLAFDNITSVASKTFPTMGRVELYLRDARRVTFKELQPRKGAAALEKAIRDQLLERSNKPESLVGPSAASLSDEIAKLAQLHAEGQLDEDEFRAAKARLIRGA